MDAHQAAEFQYRMTQLLEAQIEMEAMKAENEFYKAEGKPPKYTEVSFKELIYKHGIHHNASCEAGMRIRN